MTHRLYNSRAWRTARANFLAEHPLCAYCQQQGYSTPATVVDHIIPHKGDLERFWDVGNWQPLCAPHHDSSKRRAERRGVNAIGCNASGAPLDPMHAWNK
jgi:5-methylcytosine-specific restriction enzyme A